MSRDNTTFKYIFRLSNGLKGQEKYMDLALAAYSHRQAFMV